MIQIPYIQHSRHRQSYGKLSTTQAFACAFIRDPNTRDIEKPLAAKLIPGSKHGDGNVGSSDAEEEEQMGGDDTVLVGPCVKKARSIDIHWDLHSGKILFGASSEANSAVRSQ